MNFVCSFCGKTFKTNVLLSRHMVSHSESRPFSCDVCPKTFKRSHEVKAHRSTHDSLGERLPCERCGKKFRTKRILDQHVRIHNRDYRCKCRVCGKGFYNATKMRSHMYLHAGIRPNQCEFCPKSYLHRSDLVAHTRKAHPDRSEVVRCRTCKKDFADEETLRKHGECSGESFVCDTCGANLKSLRGLRIHAVKHSEDRPYECEKCRKKFKRRQAVVSHMQVHTAQNTSAYICDLCGNGFTRKTNLLAHILRHGKEFRYKCEDCGKGFFNKAKLNTHKFSHSGEKPFKCDSCPKGYLYRYDLLNHVANAHPDTVPPDQVHRCEKCDKSFHSQKLLASHRKLHAMEEFSCPVCLKIFPARRLLTRHLIRHSDAKPHSCKTCHKNFKRMSTLKSHLLVHTAREKTFVCDLCGFGTISKGNLTQHLRRHQKKFSVFCSECSKGFYSKAKLAEHFHVHSGEKPFCCSHCGKAFGRKENLRNHVRTHLKKSIFCSLSGLDISGRKNHTKRGEVDAELNEQTQP